MAEESQNRIVAGRYEVLRPLGRGGMGRVFLVRDLKTGEKRAMKMLRQRWQGNEKIIARFAREVDALRRLNHPCILKIFDAQQENGQLFYIMEYVKGRSVRQWLAERKQLQFQSVVRVLCLVAHALEHAHTFTIHRDISPDNVMVTSDGAVRLLDFGLAKLDDAHQNLTMIGVNMGKIQYNAPEQQLNASTVDARADIYPLGIMFFEMLTGKRPDGTQSLLELRPDLPPACEAFWRKAAARNPDERFLSAKEFRLHLQSLYKDETQTMPVLDGETPDAGKEGWLDWLRWLWTRLMHREAR